MKELLIGKNEAGQRFDKYIMKVWKAAPSSFVYKMLRKKNITLNGKKGNGSEKLIQGDVVRFFVSDETFEQFLGTPQHKGSVRDGNNKTKPKSQVSRSGHAFDHVEIIYEDEDILLINKPAGLLSQKASLSDISVVDFVVQYAYDHGITGHCDGIETFRPGICSRLDRNTSGLMSAGISLEGLQKLNEMIANRSIEKYYLAIVKGILKEKKGLLTGVHTKDHATNQVVIRKVRDANDGSTKMASMDSLHLESSKEELGKNVITGYEVVAESKDSIAGPVSLIKVHLITGQTHQIRAHLASIDHPLAGDLKYGDAMFNEKSARFAGVRRQMLHSYELVFPKQCEGVLAKLAGQSFQAKPASDFKKAMDKLGLQYPLGE